LSLRWQYQNLFQQGAYIPLDVRGEKQEHLCAFARQDADGRAVIVATPRLFARLIGLEGRHNLAARSVWSDTCVEIPFLTPETPLRHLFTGEHIQGETKSGNTTIAASRMFANFPVTLLTTL
jgi:(1->4)-alpha-D-glucan 1-alpha-D-glucosylmutase